MEHILWKTEDKDRSLVICDCNGEVVLALCKVCGGAEASLPKNCPGRRLTEEESSKIINGQLDF